MIQRFVSWLRSLLNDSGDHEITAPVMFPEF